MPSSVPGDRPGRAIRTPAAGMEWLLKLEHRSKEVFDRLMSLG
jgi:hypothetical protein